MGLLGPAKKQLGERSQAHIIARLLEVGYTVLTPYGDSSRYDLVIEDDEGQFWRVQCKTAWIENEDASIQFAVYSHELHKTYLIPASHIGNATRMRLRLVPSKNIQEKGVKWARDYEL